MREIKFRAWHKKEKVMTFVDCLTFTKNGGIWISDYPDTGNVELMQYTGLKDKNGKEIYEGDLIALLSLGTRAKAFIVEYGVQDHEDSGKSIGFNLNPDFVDAYEVIGNIWEDKELLNDSK